MGNYGVVHEEVHEGHDGHESQQERHDCLQKGVGRHEEEVREERPWQMDQGSEHGAQVDGNQGIPSRRREVSQGPGLVEEGALLVQEMSLVMKKNLDCNFKINGLRIEWGSPAFEPQTN